MELKCVMDGRYSRKGLKTSGPKAKSIPVFQEKTARSPEDKLVFRNFPCACGPGRDLVLAWSASPAVPGYGGVERSANTTSPRTSQTRAALVREHKEVLLDATLPLPRPPQARRRAVPVAAVGFLARKARNRHPNRGSFCQ